MGAGLAGVEERDVSHGCGVRDAVAGRGVALAWRGLVEPLLATGALVPVGPEAHRPDIAYQVIPSPDTPPGAIDQIADWMLELIS